MATKFASIYKQELKSKGALSSMGSAVLKSARERMDVRNIFFGGKGMLSATGQKIFGRGYSALSSGGVAAASNSQMAAQSAATGELISSNERQEALLRVVAKNTFNMNMMARDMNITRQNIATMTRLAAGKASQSQDAMWYDVKTRNQAIDSLGRKSEGSSKKSPSRAEGSSIIGNLFSGLGSILGGVASFGGSVITGALGIISRVSPILGIIALLAGGYVIKEISKVINFNEIMTSIKESISKFLGIDTKSEKGFFQQWMEKLDEKFDTKKFTEIYGTISKTITERFGPQIEIIGQSIQRATNITLAYSKAAFETLADSFIGIGEAVGYLLNEFFESNKGKIFAAIALGAMGPNALRSLQGAAITGLFTSIAGAIGDAAGEESRGDLQQLIKNLDIKIEKQSQSKIAAERIAVPGLIQKRDELKAKLNKKQKEFEDKLFGRDKPSFSDRLTANLARVDPALVGADYEGGSNFGTTGNFRMMGPDYGGGSNFGTTGNFGKETAPTQILKNMRINDAGFVSSLFGHRENPFKPGSGEMVFHRGVDIALPRNTPLEALTDGEVIAAKFHTGSGNYISIKDANGNVFTYKHLQSLEVKEGDKVRRGQLIGKSGSTGASTGPHLHLEVKDKQGNYRSPTLEELQNAITKGQKVGAASVDYVDLSRASMLPDTGGGTTIIAPQNTTVTSGGATQGFAGVIDTAAVYELFT